MRERPIIMSAPMVRALLDGTKTQTRRVYKPRETKPYEILGELPDGSHWPHSFDPNQGPEPVPCPYGQPGDHLWVKETWCPHPHHPKSRVAFKATMTTYGLYHVNETICAGNPLAIPEGKKPFVTEKWRPASHMPRWASRILLEVTDVRVQRLQDISEEDARAEGVELGESSEWWTVLCEDGRTYSHQGPEPVIGEHDGVSRVHAYVREKHEGQTARDAFSVLWNSINKPENWWIANPWVWAITFRRLTPVESYPAHAHMSTKELEVSRVR